ncbi:hypothetical protein FB45DRAFT_1025298 [Roridomyces roridus]|uniref:DUF6534 domain-containing protein n=1 Tax=Roridomyces roridus TaxID=1738132 RepID=A0AAD7BZU5_9AGAR|nr:hypothetical protein FB45DRAFT_1025298 [Roridomyces roridus]
MSSSQESAAMAALAAAIIAEMNQLGGPMLIGQILSAIFYGVTLLQTYLYYDKYGRQDHRLLLWLVGLLTFLDSLGMILSIDALWHYFIANFSNPFNILTTSWTWLFPLVLTGLIGSTVQCFYAWRVWRLSHTFIVPTAVVILATISVVTITIYVALTLIRGISAIPKITWLSTTCLACSLGADIIIATSMIFYLYQGAHKGFKKTDHIVRKLMVYTINTGVVTTICNTATVFLGIKYPATYLNTATVFLLSKCYMNSMLAFLNARESLRAHAHSFNLSNMHPSRTTAPEDIEVQVQNTTSTTYQRDHNMSLKASSQSSNRTTAQRS